MAAPRRTLWRLLKCIALFATITFLLLAVLHVTVQVSLSCNLDYAGIVIFVSFTYLCLRSPLFYVQNRYDQFPCDASRTRSVSSSGTVANAVGANVITQGLAPLAVNVTSRWLSTLETLSFHAVGNVDRTCSTGSRPHQRWTCPTKQSTCCSTTISVGSFRSRSTSRSILRLTLCTVWWDLSNETAQQEPLALQRDARELQVAVLWSLVN